jgi:hypothetical protein
MRRFAITLPIMFFGMVADRPNEAFIVCLVVWALLTVVIGHIDPMPWRRHDDRAVVIQAVYEPDMSVADKRRLASATEVQDADAVDALNRLGYTKKEAIVVLNATGWAGRNTEERVVTALRYRPPR